MRTFARLGFLSCLLALVGCVDDNVSVFVSGNLAPMIEETSCTYDPGSASQLSQGTLDVSFGGTFELHPVIQNQLQQRGASGRAETNGVRITRAEVTIEGLDGLPVDFAGLPNPFSVPMTVYIPPAASEDSPGLGTGSITAIPADYTLSLPIAEGSTTTVVVAVRLIGNTLGDIDIETGDWTYPVEICNGCLLQCPVDAETTLVSCNPGQDTPFADERCAAVPAI